MMHLIPRRRRAPAERPHLLDRTQAAEAASVSPRTISRAVMLWSESRGRQGLRPTIRRARLLRIAVADLNAWIDAGCPTIASSAARGAGA